MWSAIALSALNGVIYGMILFMVCSGLTLIYSMMGVLNLAHSFFYMLGAYFAYQLSIGLGFWVAVLVAPIVVGALGMAVEHWGLRHVHKSGHGAELLFTFGLAIVVQELVPVFWGRLPVSYRVPQSLDFVAFTVFSNDFSAYRLFALLISIGMFLVLLVVLRGTRAGLVVQAALVNPEMTQMLGHNVPRVFSVIFGLGCALAGLAGVVGGNIYTTQPSMALSFGSIAFAIVVIGGLGSLSGALVASLLVGIIQTVGVTLDYSAASLLGWLGVVVPAGGSLGAILHLKVSQLAPLTPYVLLLLILAVRPNGLLGRGET